MEKKLDIQWFIEQHSDWERLLQEKPYCITIQRDSVLGRNLVLFKYDQIESDFSLRLVRQCRGLILDEDTLEPVCVPFFKFFNAGEIHADEIDWTTAWSSEKLDGSIIKVVRLGRDILVSTNGTIDAYKAPIQDQVGFVGQTFGSLFETAVENSKNAYDKISLENHYAREDWHLTPMQWMTNLLKEGYTYMFELTSPYNKVVVRWHDTMIHFIGCRNNSTLEEIKFSEHPLARYFDTPKLFPLTNLKEVQEAAEKLDCNHEGFVVCDGNFKRNKVKSSLYVAIHHLRGEGGAMSYSRALDIIRKNEKDEVLTYFPEYSNAFDDIEIRFKNLVEEINSVWIEFETEMKNLPSRKEKALWINSKTKYSGFIFAMLDGKVSSIEEALNNTPSDKLLRLLGFK